MEPIRRPLTWRNLGEDCFDKLMSKETVPAVMVIRMSKSRDISIIVITHLVVVMLRHAHGRVAGREVTGGAATLAVGPRHTFDLAHSNMGVTMHLLIPHIFVVKHSSIEAPLCHYRDL
jgi:hypothetical protein